MLPSGHNGQIASRLGLGFGLGLVLELGLEAIFLGGNCPKTIINVSRHELFTENVIISHRVS